VIDLDDLRAASFFKLKIAELVWRDVADTDAEIT